MGESRKFGLHVTLATQGFHQLSRDLTKVMIQNVGSYIVGRSKDDTAKKIAENNPGLAVADIQGLPDLNFYQIPPGHRAPVCTKIQYIGKKHGLTGQNWRAVLIDQAKRYYRSGQPPPEHPSQQTSTQNSPDQNNPPQHRPQLAPKYTVLNVATPQNHDPKT